MSLLTQLKNDRMSAMKTGNKEHKKFLTVFLGDLESEAKRGVNITDEMVISKIKKNVQNCKDNYEVSGQDSYLKEAEFFKQYLPKTVSDEEIIKFIENSKFHGIDTIGGMMKELKLAYGQSLDGKRASQLVKEYL